MMSGSTEPDIAVATLMRNISAETGRLACVAQRLDDMLGDMAAANKLLAQPLVAELQDVDVLRQALEALQHLTASAANEISNHSSVHLAKQVLAHGIKLEKVRDACLNTGEVSKPDDTEGQGKGRPGSDEPMFFDDL